MVWVWCCILSYRKFWENLNLCIYAQPYLITEQCPIILSKGVVSGTMYFNQTLQSNLLMLPSLNHTVSLLLQSLVIKILTQILPTPASDSK